MRPITPIAITSLLIAGPAIAQTPFGPAEGSADAAETAVLALDEDLARAICNRPFGGRFAVLGLWALDGELVAIELRGDLTEYSHPPSVFYGPDGVERAIVEETPVVPGSPGALAAAAEIAEATQDGTLVETRSCAAYFVEPPME